MTYRYRVMLRLGNGIIPFSGTLHDSLDEAIMELRRAESLPSGNLASLWIEREDGEPIDHLAG